MTTQTTNYSFTKDDINEPYDVLRVNANLDAIDTEIKKKETQIGDKANLVTVTKTNLVAAINEVKEQTNSLDANKTDRLEVSNYKLITEPPTSYKRGLTIFIGTGDWTTIPGLSNSGNSVLVTTYAGDSYRSRQEVSPYLGNTILFRVCSTPDAWGQWHVFVTATQPAWITATLQSGWTGTFQYKKNDLGQVFIKANIISGTITSGTLVVALPVGYRPSIDKSILANRYDTGLTKLGFRQQLNGEFKIFGTDITTGTYQIVDDFFAG